MGPKILGPEAFAEGQSTEVQSFRWSLTLISKMLIRVITEGTVGHRGGPWVTVGHRAWYHGTMSSFSSRRPVAGSTVVMKAINTNHKAALKKAPFTDPVEPVECEVYMWNVKKAQ